MGYSFQVAWETEDETGRLIWENRYPDLVDLYGDEGYREAEKWATEVVRDGAEGARVLFGTQVWVEKIRQERE